MNRWQVKYSFCLSPGRDVHPPMVLTSKDISESRAKQKIAEGFIFKLPDESKPTASAVPPPPSQTSTGSAMVDGSGAGGASVGPGGAPGAPSALAPDASGAAAAPGGAPGAPPATGSDPTGDEKKHPDEGGGPTHRDPGPATADSGKNVATAKTAGGKGK